MAITFWLPSTSAQVAFAATDCNSSAGKSGNINLTSRVRTGSVVLCGDWTKVSKPIPNPAPKKPVANPVPKAPASSIVYTHSVVAAPNRPRISVAQVDALDAVVVLNSISQPVVRYRYLLGVPTQIRFTPVSYYWKLSDGSTSRAKNFRHRVPSPAVIVANLRVSFVVSFRLSSGSAWHPFDRTVRLNASPVRVKVGTETTNQARLRYVLFNCFQRPQAPGC